MAVEQASRLRVRLPATRALASTRQLPGAVLALALVLVGAAAIVALLSRQADDLAFVVGIAAFSIVIPALIGVLWWQRRPHWRTGSLLIALGGLSGMYSLLNAEDPRLYALGVAAEPLATALTFALIIGFAEGYVRRPIDRLLLLLTVLALAIRYVPWFVGAPSVHSVYPAYDCVACPVNPFQVVALPAPTLELLTNVGSVLVAVAAASVTVVFLRRLREARGARRRLFTTVAVTSLLMIPAVAVFMVSGVFLERSDDLLTSMNIALVSLWVLFPIGFALALLREDIVAAATLTTLLGDLAEPRRRDRWRDRLAAVIGDDALEVGFWDEQSGRYLNRDGNEVRRPLEETERVWLEVEDEGRPLAAVLSNAALTDGPEVATAAALATAAAVEADRVEATRRELLSRAATAAVAERSRMARTVQSGPQQRLAAMRVALNLAREQTPVGSRDAFLDVVATELDAAINDLRMIVWAGGSAMISRRGLGASLRSVTRAAPNHVVVLDRGLHRSHPQSELAVYYCCLEALQNAIKHAGRDASVRIRLSDSARGGIYFSVADDGVGYDAAARSTGVGLSTMHDRVSALGGSLSVSSQLGHGTVVTGWVPSNPGEPPSQAS